MNEHDELVRRIVGTVQRVHDPRRFVAIVVGSMRSVHDSDAPGRQRVEFVHPMNGESVDGPP